MTHDVKIKITNNKKIILRIKKLKSKFGINKILRIFVKNNAISI